MTRTTQAYTRNTATAEPDEPSRLMRLLSEARWIVLSGLSVYLVMILSSYSRLDPGWTHDNAVTRLHNWGGHAGAWLADVMLFVFGISAWWWCVLVVWTVWG